MVLRISPSAGGNVLGNHRNDQVHASTSGLAAHRLIPGCVLHQLPIQDQAVPLIPFEEWAPYEDEIARTFVGFMRDVMSPGGRSG